MKHIFVDFEMCMVQKNAAPSYMHFEIIQFGAVMLGERLEVQSAFSRFVRPQYGELTPEITRLTGIRPEMLTRQDTFTKVYLDFLQWIGGEPYTVYSWSANDIAQLRAETKVKGMPQAKLEIFRHWVDFQEIFTEAARLPHVPSLSHALELMQIEFVGSKHLADADAYNTARLFRLCSRLKDFEMSLPGRALAGAAPEEESREGESGYRIAAGLSPEQLALLLGLGAKE